MSVCTDQSLVVNLLPDKFVLAEGVAGLSGDRVYRSLFHLLLHGTVQHEEGLAGALLPTQTGQKVEGRGGGGEKDSVQHADYEFNHVKLYGEKVQNGKKLTDLLQNTAAVSLISGTGPGRDLCWLKNTRKTTHNFFSRHVSSLETKNTLSNCERVCVRRSRRVSRTERKQRGV